MHSFDLRTGGPQYEILDNIQEEVDSLGYTNSNCIHDGGRRNILQPIN